MLDWLARLQHHELTTARILNGFRIADYWLEEEMISKRQAEYIRKQLLRHLHLIDPDMR